MYSNHSAIFVKLQVGELDLQLETDSPKARSCFAKANEEAKANFKSTLACKLSEIPIIECSTCQDVQCKTIKHQSEIEEYTINILEAMEKAGDECLPKTGGTGGSKIGSKPRVAGWNEHVKPYSEEYKFWYQTWMSAGKPIIGDLFENMKHSKK